MSALTDALAHLTPGAVLRRLAAHLGKPTPHLIGSQHEGALCDFRDGQEEEDPSLSYGAGKGGPVFNRFGGDGFQGGALAFLVSSGIPQPEAVALLLDWAGVKEEGWKPGEGKARPGIRVTGKRAADLARMTGKLEKLAPLEETEVVKRLRGWERLTPDSEGPEAVEVARRGLTVALTGQLAAYRWTGREGPEGGPWKTFRLPGHILPGALAFEVTGPDGKPWALKVRNPGSKEDLKASGANRYAYIGKGQGAPAHFLPGEGETLAHIITEGELNAVAVRIMLDAALSGAGGPPSEAARGFAVQGVASSEAVPHVSPVKDGQAVYIYADGDAAGDKARQTWAALFYARGARVYQIGENRGLFSFKPDGGSEYKMDADACDALGNVGQFSTPDRTAAYRGGKLLEAIGAARLWKPAPSPEEADGPADQGQSEDGTVWTSKRSGYGIRAGKLCALTLKKGEDGEDFESVETLADFAAYIAAEVTQEDGSGEGARVFEMEGTRPDGRPMNPPHVTVTAAEFTGMGWAVAKWGASGIVHAGQGKKDKARAAIQILSQARGVPERTVYQHTGWTVHPEYGPVYLTAGAVIGKGGAVEGVTVELSGRLSAYALPDPAKAEALEVRAAVRASLALLDLAPDGVSVPVLGAAYRAALGPADFAVWVTGETGRNKTAYMGLVMAHHGAGWSRKYLPDGWNSSANALERSAFTVKDALFLIDDFKPAGSQSDTAKAQASVSRIFQGLADGQGRATLTADRKSRAGLWPRGLVMSSSEDLPRGHGNRARAVIVEVTRPLIGKDKAKSAAFYDGEEKAAAGVYALALASLIQATAANFEGVRAGGAAWRARVRQLAPHFEGQHGRTGDAAAELAYGWEVFLSFAVAVGAVSQEEARAYWQRVTVALEETSQGQAEHLTEADPVARALSVLSGLLSQGRVFLEDRGEGGPPPADVAPMCGYERRVFRGPDGGEEEKYQTRPGAVLVGWYSKTGGDEWGHFLPDALHEQLQRAVSHQAGAILPDAAKLWANMRDRLHPQGLMKCEAEAGGRTRATAKTTKPDGSRQQLLTLRLPLQGAYEVVGTLGTVGTDSTGSTASTASRPVPTFNYFCDGLGTVGTPLVEVPSLSPEAVPPAGPLEDPSWDDLTGGVLEGEDLLDVVKL
ncbi:hypothetical protein [Deinococcus frigens]|uniref:hypothetical protein n=1 Tax=Deinococcus frigens TaxID=249403 RepID=UPI000496BB40|nr:hypothetical protein [Deinococcus frigens]